MLRPLSSSNQMPTPVAPGEIAGSLRVADARDLRRRAEEGGPQLGGERHEAHDVGHEVKLSSATESPPPCSAAARMRR